MIKVFPLLESFEQTFRDGSWIIKRSFLQLVWKQMTNSFFCKTQESSVEHLFIFPMLEIEGIKLQLSKTLISLQMHFQYLHMIRLTE